VIKGDITPEGEGSQSSLRPTIRAKIDELSKRIIELLQVDGRRPFAEVAEILNVDEESVAQRVQALIDNGVIQITAVSDPLQLGFARQAMLGISVEKGLAKAVAERLAEVPEIVYIVLTAGGFEILAEVVGTSDAHLLELVTSVIKPTPGVVTIQTFLYHELQKQTYTWGVR
jgi:Lrp/AsnC family transcriptional regulator, regulator for asnA, asnC and gidA